MLKNYLTIGIRNLKRHKLYSAINILGLAVGMACCFMILLFVLDELSYDTHHPSADHLYRVINGESAKTAPVLAPTMTAHLPEVAQVTRLMDEYRALVSLLAFAVAVSLFEILLPVFNRLFETSLTIAILSQEWMVFGGVCIALFVGVMSGAYSAFFLSSFSPIQAIRGMMKTGTLNTFFRLPGSRLWWRVWVCSVWRPLRLNGEQKRLAFARCWEHR